MSCCFLLALTASLAVAATVTVRSGNGSVGGRDSSVTFLLGPPNADFTGPLTQADFSYAQNGAAAFIIAPDLPLWAPSLNADPAAKWIGSSSTSSTAQGNTALYAISFTIPNPFSSATLALNYAVDDGLGVGQQVLYLNGHALYLTGNAACTTSIGTATQFGQENSSTCAGINSFLQVGANWLYFDDVNLAGEAGIIFSATITTTDVLTSPQPSITSLTPSAVPAGSGPLTLTVNGNGFFSSSAVAFKGIAHPSSFISSGQLSILLTSADLAAPGSFPVVVTNPAPGGGVSQAVTLTVTAPSPTITAVVNAASFQSGPVAPGEIVTIGGTGIGPASAATLTLDQNGNVATSLGGVQVLFNGFAAPLTYVSSAQINAVVPYQIAGLLSPSVQVIFQGQTSKAFPLLPANSIPALFTSNGSGTGPAAILNQDNSYNAPNHPAAKGSYVVLYMTGEGQTSPAGVTGKVTTASAIPPLTPQPLLPVAVLIGGQPATVAFYGEAPGLVSGVMQINVQIPANVPSGNLAISVFVGPNTSQNGVTVSVQ